MVEDPTTRARILATATRLFRKQGYHATGLTQVLTEGKAPKGSLYFHFPGGKEQLGTEAVRDGAAELADVLGRLAGTAADPRAGLVAVTDALAKTLEESGFSDGCPITGIALDAAAESESIRTACAESYAGWTERIAAALAGWGVPAGSADPLATVVLSAIEGALVLARVRRSGAPLREVGEQLGALLTRTVER